MLMLANLLKMQLSLPWLATHKLFETMHDLWLMDVDIYCNIIAVQALTDVAV